VRRQLDKSSDGSAIVGHVDRTGLGKNDPAHDFLELCRRLARLQP
jgi:hypothetical protein